MQLLCIKFDLRELVVIVVGTLMFGSHQHELEWQP
jgi:hypothetical protein